MLCWWIFSSTAQGTSLIILLRKFGLVWWLLHLSQRENHCYGPFSTNRYRYTFSVTFWFHTWRLFVLGNRIKFLSACVCIFVWESDSVPATAVGCALGSLCTRCQKLSTDSKIKQCSLQGKICSFTLYFCVLYDRVYPFFNLKFKADSSIRTKVFLHIAVVS